MLERNRADAQTLQHLRHLSTKPGHPVTHLHQLEQVDRPGRLLHHRLAAIRRIPKRRLE